MNDPRFPLWKLLTSVTCFAVSAGTLRFSYFEMARYGFDGFIAMCCLVAVLSALAGIGLIFPRVAGGGLRLGIGFLEIWLRK